MVALSGDFRQHSFSIVSRMRPHASEVIQLTAICSVKGCPNEAPYTVKIGGDLRKTREVGGADMYKPVCRQCMKTVETDALGTPVIKE